MFFASDNSGPVPPQVLDALARANDGYAMGYGADPLTAQVCNDIRALFEAPEAAVYLVGTGTAANVLALATLVQPYDTVFCTPEAHINVDECNAPEFFSGGAKLTLVPEADKMTPATLRTAIEGEENRGVHGPQRGAVSITNVTEGGNLYTLDEIRALTAVAREYGLPVHLDGARFANACVALGCTPAEMSWKAGVDVAVFGGTKNGLMGVEAVIFFDARHAKQFELRRKRGAQLFSKGRYLAAQMQAVLQGDLWFDLASRANGFGARLRAGLDALGVEVLNRDQTNMIFFNAPRRVHRKMQAAGAVYHVWGKETGPDGEIAMGRLVCDWSIGDNAIDEFLSHLRAAL